jgi:DNA replication licensing factor MCM2
MPLMDNIRDLRYIHLNKLIHVIGVITKRSVVYSQLKKIAFKCYRCGQVKGDFFVNNFNDVKQINLGQCTSCQSNGPFLIDKSLTVYRNYQVVTIQESPGEVPAGRIPRQKEVVLLGDNIDVARPGDEVELIGVYMNKYSLRLNVTHGFPVFSTTIEANYIRRIEDTDTNSKGDAELENEFKKMKKDPLLVKKLINSVAPNIYGHENIKMAVLLAMFGGVERTVEDTHRVRGDINVLIMGDPGTAKSQFLKSVQNAFYRCIYTTGKGASAVGLTASVKRDFATNEWVLEAGALVLADKGICLIDEFDKMNEKDRTSIHEAMEQQSISISKAGIVTTLRARCSVIAAANPIHGRYNPQISFRDNVDLT